MAKSKNFVFDGGAGTFFGTALLATLITILTVGIAYPYALVLMQRWIVEHTDFSGKQASSHQTLNNKYFAPTKLTEKTSYPSREKAAVTLRMILF